MKIKTKNRIETRRELVERILNRGPYNMDDAGVVEDLDRRLERTERAIAFLADKLNLSLEDLVEMVGLPRFPIEAREVPDEEESG